ncbi:hypothetical protein Cpin_4792 [Chitinophaga pinensis DSM 2588]|uniref:Uncharacterized protein n=2 Tax=Chitinophaga pinensis TaxID=79329 RepID=A0A979GX66_CHIPD|nr:hypothetical protein Cpin_4792 [Chitinophaga pinensis DSM 2588]
MGVADYYSKWKVKNFEKQQYPQFADSFHYFSNADNRYHPVVIVAYVPQKQDTLVAYFERVGQRRATPVPVKKETLLTVHGNVVYDLFYQSNIDTPFVQKDVYQHTVQTSLELTYKDNYPIRVNFTTRMSNSSLFRNLTDFNLQYTNRDFKNAVLQKAKNWDAGKYAQLEKLQQLKSLVDAKQLELDSYRKTKADPSLLQQIIEAREKAYYARIKDSLAAIADQHKEPLPALTTPATGMGRKDWNDLQIPAQYTSKRQSEKEKADSALQHLNKQYNSLSQKTDSLQKELSALLGNYKEQEKIYNTRKNTLTDILTHSKDNKELAENLKAMNLPDSVLPAGYKHLLAIRTVGIGRMLVDYSELTAKNISILGGQIEYNPGYYFAFATGKVDYRFRDFIFNESKSRQYLNLIRVGKGMRNGNNVILTYYTGKKQVYNFNTVPDGNPNAANLSQQIKGLSLEGRWQLNSNNYITGEIAKSSLPSYAVPPAEQHAALDGIFRLNDHSNEAYSLKSGSLLPGTGTRITGMYKMMGANFQSFSLYTTGSTQTGWSVAVDQPFFRQQLTVSGSIRKNDFVTSYQQTNFRSNTVFKSIRATMRIRKLPVITVGYFPSSQLTKMDNGSYTENLFYNLLATASHSYHCKGFLMNTILTYTQFYNKQADSSFLYFNSKNLQLTHTIFANKLTINGGGSFATNPEYNLLSGDGNLQYRMASWLDVGAGVKYNYQTAYRISQTGYSGNARIVIPKLGEIAFMAEKAFIPGMQKRLLPSNNGRLTYTKTF